MHSTLPTCLAPIVRRVRTGWVLASCLLVWFPPGWTTEAADLGPLKGAVHELVALRKAAYEATAEWEEQKVGFDLEEELLGRELNRIRERIDEREKRCASLVAERNRLRAELATQREAMEQLRGPLAASEKRLRKLVPALPAPLRSALTQPMARIGDPDRPPTLENLAERLRLVFSVLTEIRQFDGGVHLTKEILEPPGGPAAEMEVLYLGLGMAFAVNRSDTIAGRARFTGNAWQWEWNASWCSAVRAAVAVYQKENPASFVALPMAFGEGAE